MYCGISFESLFTKAAMISRSPALLRKFLNPRVFDDLKKCPAVRHFSFKFLRQFDRANKLLNFSCHPRYCTGKMSEKCEDKLVWIDLEMTGLHPETDHILEVACLITDSELNIISEEHSAVINQPDSILANMNEWCMINHQKTGLTDACKKSTTSLEAAEQNLLQFLKRYVPEKKCPLSGSSVYMDRLFLIKYMPLVNDYLHYRIVDASSIKELARRWTPEVYAKAPTKNNSHRALDDIRESIRELKYYKDEIFNRSV